MARRLPPSGHGGRGGRGGAEGLCCASVGAEPERSCCTYCDPVDLLLCASVEAATLFPGRFSLTLPLTEQRAPGRGVGGHGPAHAAFCIHGVSAWGGGRRSPCGVGRPSADAAGHDCGVESQLQRHCPRLWPPQLHQPGRSASGIGWVHMGVRHPRLKTRGAPPPPSTPKADVPGLPYGRHLQPCALSSPSKLGGRRRASRRPDRGSGGPGAGLLRRSGHGSRTAMRVRQSPAAGTSAGPRSREDARTVGQQGFDSGGSSPQPPAQPRAAAPSHRHRS